MWITDGPLLIEGDVSVNLATHEVRLKGHRVKFTATEEALFYMLVGYAGKVVTRLLKFLSWGRLLALGPFLAAFFAAEWWKRH